MPTGSSSYPGALDTFAPTRADGDLSGPDVVKHAAALAAIETELGVNPSADAATVAARILAVESTHLPVFNVKTGYGAAGDGVADDGPECQAAINAAEAAGGGVVYFPKGTYLISTIQPLTGGYGLGIKSDNIHLVGAPGSKIKQASGAFVIYMSGGGKPAGLSVLYTGNHYYQAKTVYTFAGPVAKYATSVTLATPAQASNFAVGDYIYLRTGQCISTGVTEPDAEVNKVSSANAGTGVIELEWPTGKPYVQEYFVSGTSGLTSVAVTANPALFGVANVNAVTIRNIKVLGLEFDCPLVTNGVIVGGQVDDVEIAGCSGVIGSSFQSMGDYVHGDVHNNGPLLVKGIGYVTSAYSVAKGSSHVTMSDNEAHSDTANGTLQIHAAEGTADIKTRGNSIFNLPFNGPGQPGLSIRFRAYDHDHRENVLVNGATDGVIVIDDTCTDGGVITDNLISHSPNSASHINNAGTGWYTEGNRHVGTRGKDIDCYERAPQVPSDEKALVAWVAHNDQNQPLGQIPADVLVTSVQVIVVEAFNSNGTDLLTIGDDTDPDGVATAIDVSTVGDKTVALGAYLTGSKDRFNNTARSLECYYVNGGTEPTTGAVLVAVKYVRVPREINL